MCNGDRAVSRCIMLHSSTPSHKTDHLGSPTSHFYLQHSQNLRSWNWICPKSTPRLPLVLSPTSKLILCVTFWPYSPDCPHITSQHPLPVLTWPYTSRDSNRFTNRNGHPTSQDIYYSNWAAINTDLFDVEANRLLIKTKWHRRNILCSMPPSFELPSQSMCG